MIRVRSDDVAYPAVFIFQNHFKIVQGSRSLSGMPGLLVDRDGRCYRVIGADSPRFRDGRSLTRAERRAITDAGVTLVCEGEPFSTTAGELRQTVVSLVSARGHFESRFGFGLPAAVGTASTVYELLEVLGGGQDVFF